MSSPAYINSGRYSTSIWCLKYSNGRNGRLYLVISHFTSGRPVVKMELEKEMIPECIFSIHRSGQTDAENYRRFFLPSSLTSRSLARRFALGFTYSEPDHQGNAEHPVTVRKPNMRERRRKMSLLPIVLSRKVAKESKGAGCWSRETEELLKTHDSNQPTTSL